jgi:hypothetical protein
VKLRIVLLLLLPRAVDDVGNYFQRLGSLITWRRALAYIYFCSLLFFHFLVYLVCASKLAHWFTPHETGFLFLWGPLINVLRRWVGTCDGQRENLVSLSALLWHNDINSILFRIKECIGRIGIKDTAVLRFTCVDRTTTSGYMNV